MPIWAIVTGFQVYYSWKEYNAWDYSEGTAKIIRQLTEKADAGDMRCAFQLANYHYFGISCPRDKKKAVELLKKAAMADVVPAQTRLALLLHHDFDLKDDVAAVNWLEKAIAAGDIDARRFFATWLPENASVNDQKRALDYLFEAAQAEDVEVMYLLSQKYNQGQWVAEDKKEAFTWLQKAAGAGHEQAGLELSKICLFQPEYERFRRYGEQVLVNLVDACHGEARTLLHKVNPDLLRERNTLYHCTHFPFDGTYDERYPRWPRRHEIDKLRALFSEDIRFVLLAKEMRWKEALALAESRSIDINTRDLSGSTALHYAARIQDYMLITRLLELGANPNIKDVLSHTPWYYIRPYYSSNSDDHSSLVAKQKKRRLLKLLVMFGADPHDIFFDFKKSDETLCKYTIRRRYILDTQIGFNMPYRTWINTSWDVNASNGQKLRYW